MKLEEIFSRAVTFESDRERAVFIEDACGSDAGLRSQVEALLKAHGEAGDFLNTPIVGETGNLELPPPAEQPGTRIGRYKLLQLIGEGGFGAVYMAEQEEPVRRKVAVKIIKLGMDTKQVIARFEAERQALAMMDHPHIARVFDGGTTENGRPYFVMELVKGIPITDFCDKGRLSSRERLVLFKQVCQAVQHAHQKGIIHRDIKPNNVLVTLHDTTAVPKMIDFGIAKATNQRLTEKTLFTEFRQFIGTPEYMSPDQAEISGLDVDTRTDIYSLGVLLYVLLTGTTPFDARTMRSAGFDELKRVIRDVDPPKPSVRVHTMARTEAGSAIAVQRQSEPIVLSRLMHGELDWIVMKAMEKDRTRRYQTASELVQDIDRYLNHEPVLAGPPSTLYRLRKFVRRNRLAVGASTLVALSLVVGLVGATVFYFEAARERDAARAARARADAEARHSERIASLLEDLFVSTSPDEALVRGVDAEHLLDAAREAFGGDHAAVPATLSSRALQLQSAGDMEGAERLYGESLRLWRERYGDNNINVAATLRSLGLLQMAKGDNQAAEQAFRECIRITRALPNKETLTLAETLSLLAGVLSNRAQYEEAIELLDESIRIRKAVAPEQRLQIATTTNALTTALSLAGKEDRLGSAMTECVAAWRAALPADGPVLGRVLTQSAAFHMTHNAMDAAEGELEEALRIFQKPGNITSQYHLLAMEDMYQLLERRGEPAKAVGVALRSFEAARQIGDEQATGAIEATLANTCWYLARNPRRPRAEHEEAMRGIEDYLASRPTDFRAINTRGVLQYRLGEYAAALATLRQCDEHNSRQYQNGHPTDSAFIAMTYKRLGLPEEARAALVRLRQAMQSEQFANDEDCRKVAGEAEAIVDADQPQRRQENDLSPFEEGFWKWNITGSIFRSSPGRPP